MFSSVFFLLFGLEQIVLSPGHQKIISNVDVIRASIGNSSIANVKVLTGSEQVIVTAFEPGNTDLILWLKGGEKETYSVQVGNQGTSPSAHFRSLLGGIEGVEFKQTGDSWTLEGEIYRRQDAKRIAEILKIYPKIVNLTHMNPEALKFVLQEIQADLSKGGFKGVTLESSGDTLVLEGSVHGKTEEEKLKRLVGSKYPNFVVQVSSDFKIEQQIFVDVKLMEIKTNSLGQIGVQWPAAVNILDPSNLPITLQALISKGFARILSNPKLLCRNGTPASFLAGGEFPIRLVSEHSASVQFKPYGILLEITARMDPHQNVVLEIESKISDLDPSTAVDNIPGILEHQIKTAANLRMGDTIVLGGLFDNRAKKNVQKIPFLGHIPILGELFKSRDFQENRSEFLAFLTPIPADSTSPLAGSQILNFQQHHEEIKKKIHPSILD